MNISIIGEPKNTMENISAMIRLWHEEIPKNQIEVDAKRLSKKLIRDRSVLLKIPTITMEIDMPIFLLYDCKNILSIDINKEPYKFNIDDLGFESNSKFTTKEELHITSIFKKVKSNLKEEGITDWNKIKYFLPLSTIIKNRVVLTYQQIFCFFAWAEKNTNAKIQVLKTDLLDKLFEVDPIFFNKQNVDIYIANEESA